MYDRICMTDTNKKSIYNILTTELYYLSAIMPTYAEYE